MTWKEYIEGEKDKRYMQILKQLLADERASYNIYPPEKEVLTAFKLTPFDKVKCVLLGQDPYYHPGQAFGLAYSVRKGLVVPPSLVNIYKELSDTIPEFETPLHGDLTQWAERGALLTNSMLTVRQGASSTHANIGWQPFTDGAIAALSKHRENIVFVLWGNFAKAKRNLIDESKHLVLQSAHPSPRSADKGFFGCNHFVQINEYLESTGQAPIDWQIT